MDIRTTAHQPFAAVGPFEDFIARIVDADLEIKGLEVRFDSPGNGQVEFSWTDPLVVNGSQVPLHANPRFDNPYSRVEFGSLVYEIEFEGQRLMLDFENGIREAD